MAVPGRSTAKQHVLSLERAGWIGLLESIGCSTLHAERVLKGIHQSGLLELSAIEGLPNHLQAWALEHLDMAVPLQITRDDRSVDGTRRFVFSLHDGNQIETVYIPEERRGTLCISSQAGCPLECTFCLTGKQGFNRNCSTAEIIGQVWQVIYELGDGDYRSGRQHITNIVMMGMGEPLLNESQLYPALRLMTDDCAYGLSKHRVTVSTSGIVPAMLRLYSAVDVALAVSLHAPTDCLRDEIVPINRKYPLEKLMAACHVYTKHRPKRSVTFEYVMLEGVNDQTVHAQALVALIKDVTCKVNLIPFNPFKSASYQCSPLEQIQIFQNILHANGIVTTIRKTRGQDIDAACGQLAGEVLVRQATRLQKPLKQFS